MKQEKLRLVAFGLRKIPLTAGGAGSDTVADEVYPRLASRGHEVTVYCRHYKNDHEPRLRHYKGLRLIHLKTVSSAGFDSLIHSFFSTLHIIFKNTGDVIHIHNGGNTFWALPLRIFGKRVYVNQDGLDWDREKWPWYARLFLRLSMYMMVYFPNNVIFDNIFTKEQFENKFRKTCRLIWYGSDYKEPKGYGAITKYGLTPKDYFLFVGRFIPEKGVHYLISAFQQLITKKKLIIVGGSPNSNSDYEKRIRSVHDDRIHFLGYIYGDEMLQIMKQCYCYIQSSDVEGLSPILLTAMGMGIPLICSNIRENVYAVEETALTFEKGDIQSLKSTMEIALANPKLLQDLSAKARERALNRFTWDGVAQTYEQIFMGN